LTSLLIQNINGCQGVMQSQIKFRNLNASLKK
jgi:hypothetical protein